ncbi:MAG: TPM domain-containing protein [Verrucomicrobiota bacterium]
METKVFISKLDEEKIVAAIAAAEQKTSGEIRLCISNRKREDALEAAQKRFEKLGMTQTRERNAALIYFAPLTQKFAVVGDIGIHAKCGADFWQAITTEMNKLLQAEQFTAAILYAIEKVGDVLATHFPQRPDDTNELPNHIVGD